MNLLQDEALNACPSWHFPLHLAGTGGISASLKLGDSGQIPDHKNQIHYLFLKFICQTNLSGLS
jgi:hypothetical protein